MKVYCILLFLFMQKTCCSQNITFSERGLNIVALGSVIDTLKYSPISIHENKEKMQFWFDEDFTYYFVKNDNLILDGTHSIKDIILATNKTNEIVGIFIFINTDSIDLIKIISTVFDEPKLQSNMSIGGYNPSQTLFWKKNDTTILYRESGKIYAQISLTIIPFDQITPGVGIEY